MICRSFDSICLKDVYLVKNAASSYLKTRHKRTKWNALYAYFDSESLGVKCTERDCSLAQTVQEVQNLKAQQEPNIGATASYQHYYDSSFQLNLFIFHAFHTFLHSLTRHTKQHLQRTS
jgi:hypothetical protein